MTQSLSPKEHERLDIDKQINFSFVEGFERFPYTFFRLSR